MRYDPSLGGGGGGGSISDNVDYDYTSSASVSSFPTQVFLGGASGDMMALGVGSTFAKTGWTRLSNQSVCDWKGSTTRTRNRSKSFKFDALGNGEVQTNARGTYGVDCGGYDRLYFRQVCYWEINASFPGCQWKMFRHHTRTDHTGGGGPEVVDGSCPSAYWTNAVSRDNMPWSQFRSNNPNYVFGDAFTQFAYDTNPTFTVAAPQNQWFLMEHYFQENSTTSTSDGVGMIQITLANGTNHITATTSNRIYRGTNDYSAIAEPFRYFNIQNYFGNAGDSTGYGGTILHTDDLAIVAAPAGTANPRIRCEITDGVSEPVFQPWVLAGCSGTARRIKPNLGHLTTFSGCTLKEYDATNAVTYSKVL